MKKFILFSVTFLLLGFAKAQVYVSIPDRSLAFWLKQNYSTCMTDGIVLNTQCPDVLNATELDPMVDSNITGLEYFTGAQKLVLSDINSGNPITRLEGKYPPNLTDLGFYYVKFKFMSDTLPANLKDLSLPNTQIQQLPILPSGLRYLDIRFNSSSDFLLPSSWPSTLDTLMVDYDNFQNQSFPALPPGILYYSAATITYKDSFPALPSSLLYLNIDNSNISFTDTSFTWPPNLTYLNCGGNSFPGDTLPTLPANLQLLSAELCGLIRPPLYPNTLQSLDLSYNNISSFTRFPQGLLSLSCAYDSNSTLPALPASLTSLSCGGYNFTTIPVLPAGLLQLTCDASLITSIPPLPASVTNLQARLDCLLTSLPSPLPHFLTDLIVDNDSLLTCLPPLPTNMYYLNYLNTGISCLPNYPVIYYYSGPAVNTMPLCDINGSCPSLWNISGSVYYNSGVGCVHQPGEPLIHPVKMNLWQAGNLIQQVYAPGVYSFKTDFNNYNVELDTTSAPFDFSCLSDSTITISPADSMQVVNFEAHCKNGFDLGVNYVYNTGKPFPGSTTLVQISAGDVIQNQYGISCNTAGLSGLVQITITGLATYAGAGNGVPAPTSVNGNTITWNVADFSQGSGRYDILIQTDTNATYGDVICMDISITPTNGDNNPSNNNVSQCLAVQNSFDPNYKEVSPVNGLAYPYNDWLTYTIHFQNTGTAAAHNIIVTDTLDANVDPRSFELLAYSYEPIVQITGRYVKFVFQQIMLPDSNANPQGSSGYVQYRVKPLANLGIGTSISNTAYIYFDFNAPVVTNTTASTVTAPTGIKNIPPATISIYPNPNSVSTWQLIVDNSIVGSALDVFDEEGRLVFHSAISNQRSAISLNVPAGVYYLRISNDKVSEVRKLVKL